MKILVIGKTGQLGNAIYQKSLSSKDEFIFTSRKDLDLEDIDSINTTLSQFGNLDLIINCSAYTAVDKAETEIEKSVLINEKSVSQIGQYAESNGIKFLHFSTDYVYDNGLNTPNVENGKLGLNSQYAKSKYAGEQAIINNSNTVIIRTSWVYGNYGNNFLNTMIRLGKSRDSLSVVFDQIGSPTYVEDLANLALALSEMDWKGKSGVYNFSNEGVCSWYDFAYEIFKQTNIECKLSPILSEEYPTPAKRPHFSVMNKNKIKTSFGIEILHWTEALKNCLANR